MGETRFQKLVNNNFLFRLYLLKSLPLAFIAGIKVKELTSTHSITIVRYKWLTQNPFRSMYFACEAMAAEMSTGLIIIDKIYKSNPAISMLIIANKATFYKKATGKITFTCNDGNRIEEIIKEVKRTGNAVTSDILSIGTDEKGHKVAEFVFTWSLKVKSKFINNNR